MRRYGWLILGLAATACGLAGVVLPLVPATPFLLVAAFAFARSSPRLHGWLLSHPRLGGVISNWQVHGRIDRGAKRAAIIAMLATVALSWVAGVPGAYLIVQALALGAVAVFVLTRPD